MDKCTMQKSILTIINCFLKLKNIENHNKFIIKYIQHHYHQEMNPICTYF